MKLKCILIGILMSVVIAANVQATSIDEEQQMLLNDNDEMQDDQDVDNQSIDNNEGQEEFSGEEMDISSETMIMSLDLSEDEGVSTVSNIQPTLQYRAHVSNIGWMNSVESGVAGTTGKNLAMEAVEISVKDCEQLGIQYQVHVSNIGWMDSVSNGAMAGTTGRALALEAIRINLTGDLADSYDIYYRAHITDYGWLGWAKNGESAGSQGYACTLQAIEIILLPAGSSAPANTGRSDSFIAKFAVYHQAYVQNLGWMAKSDTSVIAGTTGRNLNLDALKLSTNDAYGIGISYSAHVRNVGWMNYVSDGKTAGIIQEGYTIEALKVHLTGDNAGKYDIYYRAHIANVGWLDWAKNDEVAGSFGLGYAMQAIEIRIVNKGASAPGSTGCSYIQKPSVTYKSLVGSSDWQENVKNGAISGTTGKNVPLRAFSISLSDMDNLSVKYCAHVSNIGWQSYVSEGKVAGTTNTTNNIEAIQIELTGSASKYYDIWYRVHSANIGWLGWAKNGEMAGTSSLCYDAQAVQIVVSLKGTAAPGNTDRAYVNTLEESYLWPVPSSTRITSYFGYRTAPTAGASTYHQGIDIGASAGEIIVATKSGTVTECAYNSTRGYYVEITHNDGVKTIYMHMSRQAVSTGTKVSRGQTVGYIGSTGVATGPHLHFSVVVNGTNVNPLNYVSY